MCQLASYSARLGLSKIFKNVGKGADFEGLSARDMKLEDRIRELLRFKHYSIRTEDSYVGWYRQFVKFHGLRHP
jgi:hypothetical protein